MVELDLPKVSALADEHYPPELYESLEALEQKFLAYSPGCYVAVDGQTIIGYIFSHPWDTRPVKLNYVDGFTIPLEPICYYVHDMLIAPAYRKRSLGRAMAEIVLAHATLDGFSRIDLVAIDDNSAVIFYRPCYRHIPAPIKFFILNKNQYIIPQTINLSLDCLPPLSSFFDPSNSHQ